MQLAETRLPEQAALQAEPADPLIVFPGCELRLLADVDIESLALIDAEMMRRLIKLGLRTLGDLQAISYPDLHRIMGRQALRLLRLASGLDGDPVLPAWPRPSLTVELSFGCEVTQLEPVYEALHRCSKKLSQALQMRREFASLLTLCLIREDTSRIRIEERLPRPTQLANGLYDAAVRLLHRLAPSLNEMLTAVSLSADELSIATATQLELMDMHGNPLPAESRKKVQVTIDHVRSKFGIGAVLSAATMQKERRIDFWALPLCHQLNETIEVNEAPDGRPLRFWRRQQLYLVCSILQEWCETCWSWDDLRRTTVFRIETDPSGLFELQHRAKSWRLTAAYD